MTGYVQCTLYIWTRDHSDRENFEDNREVNQHSSTKSIARKYCRTFQQKLLQAVRGARALREKYSISDVRFPHTIELSLDESVLTTSPFNGRYSTLSRNL